MSPWTSPTACSKCWRWCRKAPSRSRCGSPQAGPSGWKSAGLHAIWGMSGSLGPPRGSPPIRSNSPAVDSTRGGHLLLEQMVVSSEANEKLILALPKGRILNEAAPLFARAGIEPEAAFADPDARQLRFTTNHADLDIIRVRSFDVATFVAFGAAHLGIAGADVLMEFDYPEIYAPIDLGIGKCRLAVAEPVEMAGSDDPRRWSHVRIATKYPEVTRRHFAARGVQAECVKLSGAMELAPSLGLSHRIVDLVDSGRTLKENGLVEIEHIADITSRFIVNRAALKTQPERVGHWVDRFREISRAA